MKNIEEMNLVELKASVYDRMVAVQNINREIEMINQIINKKSEEEAKNESD